MKRILISVMTIALVSVVAFGVTKAFFTDTETSIGNTFSTGTIDIAVDNENPWVSTNQYQLTDMKPSQTDYINFTINNVGTNPVNVWKKLTVTGTGNDPVSEPECQAENGEWVSNTCDGNAEKSDIDTIIDYDLSVKLYNPSGVLVWWQMLYNKDVTIAGIEDNNLFLGMIPEGWHMDVVQSYHMRDSENQNWAQGDSMTFDITLTGEQLKGIAVLEDKTGEPDWRVKTETTDQGTLTYGVKDAKFNFSFTGEAPLANTDYSLIVYKEPWSIPASGAVWPRPVIVLVSDTSDGSGNVIIPDTSIELNTNLLNTKIWLVKTDDLVSDTISGWNPADYLFDTGLIDYYDSDL